MMVDSVLDDAQTPIMAPSSTSSGWATFPPQQAKQPPLCPQTLDDLNTNTGDEYDEYARWILTASQKKLHRESRTQKGDLSTQLSDINTTLTGHKKSSGDEDTSNDNNIGTTKAWDDNAPRIRRRKSLQLDLQAALASFEKHCDVNEANISNLDAATKRKQTRRRHTSLPATTPTRLPTPKSSTIQHHLSPHVLQSGYTASPTHLSSVSRTIHTSFLSQHKQPQPQQFTTTSWLNFDPYDSTVIPIAPKTQQNRRRPISMLSRPSYTKTCDSTQIQDKTDQQLVVLDTFLSRGPLKCMDTDRDTPGIAGQTVVNKPKTPPNQNTTTTRIPLPITKKLGSNSSNKIDKPSTSSEHQPCQQQSGRQDDTEPRRRPSLMSSDSLKDQQKQLQHLDINLVSVQGELCVPDGISQERLDHRQQQHHHLSSAPTATTTTTATLPKIRPSPRRGTSLQKRLHELTNFSSPWNEDTESTGGRVNANKKKGIPVAPASQRPTSATAAAESTSFSGKQQTTPKQHDSPPRPAMSPPTAYKLFRPHLSPFEQQEILKYPKIYFVGNHAKHKHHATMDRKDSNYGYDDSRGDYVMVQRDHLAYRYEMLEIMGKGSFGQVIKAYDYKSGSTVAVKIIRNKKRFHAQALVEVKTLEDLLKWDPDDKHNNVRMTDHFYFRNHLCIAFECLDMNLYDYLKDNHFQGSCVGLIRRFTTQLLNSLVLLHQHHLIHCDLKPENILLKHRLKSSIKVIDFGSSCLENEKVYTYIQSRFYRAPEIILGLDYGVEIDMWSVGCILAELYTGRPLFPGENEQDQLACIMEIQGVPSLSIVEKCTRRKNFFDAYGNPKITANSKGLKRRPDTKSLARVLKCTDTKFVDFIDQCLQWNPADRLKSEEAFKHGWIAKQ